MADNLTVTIGADSSKLRAELALVSQATKTAQKELADLAAAFNKTGSSADRINLDAKARQLDQYKRSAAGLKQELAGLSAPLNNVGKSAEHAASGFESLIHQGRGLGRVVSEFSNLSRGLESVTGIFGRVTGGFAGGLAGFAIGKAFNALKDQIDEVSKSLGELRKTAGEIGIKPIALQAAQDVVTGIGQDADVATKMLQGMSTQLDDVRKKSTQPTGEASGVSVLRGGAAGGSGGLLQLSGAANQAVQVFRGGVQPIKDFTKPLEALNLDLSHIPTGKLGDLQRLNEILAEFVRVSKTLDPTALNILSKSLFGIASDESLRAAPALLRNLEAEIARLQQSSRGATDKTLAQDEEVRASKDKLAKSWSEAMASMAASARPGQIAINAVIADIVTKLSDGSIPAAIAATWHQFLADITTQSDTTWTAFLAGAQTAADGFKSIWQSTLDWLSSAAGTVVSAVKSAAQSTADAIGNAATSGVPFASGGMVRGSGTGTSDSIMARLSNGEFVMRAAAVQHWGPQLLASLNSLRNPGFALGGLVSPLPQFAGGGLVGGGGTPVHLHLGGNTFALSGHDNVVNALVVEAHRQQMRSAGTKPSWFAARPGG